MLKKKVVDVYNEVISFPEQISDSYNNIKIPINKFKFNRIVLIGMGGSYIGGILLKEFLRDELRIPIEVFNGEMPIIDENCLVILVSYSGNSKEVLLAYNKYKKHEKMIIVTSSGKLLKNALKNEKVLIKIPENLHPRFNFSYGVFPLLRYFENCKLIKKKGFVVNDIIKTLKKYRPQIEEEAKHLAIQSKNQEKLLFYSSNYFYPAAYRLQTSIEEDAKVICHANKLTELFHNELEAIPNKKSFCVLLIDPKETTHYKKQIIYFKRLIKHHEIKYKRFSKEVRMFIVFYLVDFYGYYLSKLYHTKMGKTPLSDYMKKL